MLASISNGGLVTGLMELPATARSLTGTFDVMMADGFEGSASVNGCYRLFDTVNAYVEWTWGANTVSTHDSSEDNVRPLFTFTDADCTLPSSPTSPIAHADSQEEAEALCLTENYPFAFRIDPVTPQPPVGQFYGCGD